MVSLLVFRSCLNGEFCTENICEFGTKSIPAAGHFSLLVVIIARSKQLTEDELRHVDVMLFVYFNRDALAVV